MALFSVVGLSSSAAEATAPTQNIHINVVCHQLGSPGGGGTGCFAPKLVTVVKGQKVLWTNTTPFHHTVTRCKVAAGACPVSGGTGTDLRFKTSPKINAPGGTFSFTFNGSGTYVYYCTIHGYAVMHGTVVVH